MAVLCSVEIGSLLLALLQRGRVGVYVSVVGLVKKGLRGQQGGELWRARGRQRDLGVGPSLLRRGNWTRRTWATTPASEGAGAGGGVVGRAGCAGGRAGGTEASGRARGRCNVGMRRQGPRRQSPRACLTDSRRRRACARACARGNAQFACAAGRGAVVVRGMGAGAARSERGADDKCN